MKTHVIIPAHIGSKRFPRKVLHEIEGVPMVGHVVISALESRGVDKVFVASDSSRVLRVAADCDAIPVLTSDQPRNGTERVAEAVEILNIPDDDIVINVQADQPYFGPDLIQLLAEADFMDMATLRYPARGMDENDVRVSIAMDQSAIYFTRAPIPGALKHIGIYAYTVGFLRQYQSLSPSPLELGEGLEQMRAIQNRLEVMTVLSPYDVISVNKPEDIAKC